MNRKRDRIMRKVGGGLCGAVLLVASGGCSLQEAVGEGVSGGLTVAISTLIAETILGAVGSGGA